MSQFIIHNGKEEVLVRGGDFQWEMCHRRKIKDRKNEGEYVEVWEPFLFYSSTESALNRIFDMKLRACEAKSLEELQEAIKRIRKEIKLVYDDTINGRR